MLFGDGAGAVVVERATTTVDGVLGEVVLGADGSTYRHIIVPAGGARVPLSLDTRPSERYLAMAGREVFAAAVTRLTGAATEALAIAGWSTADSPWLVAHQANQRILSAVARALGLSEDRVVRDLDRYGNTSAASIPMALTHHAHRFRPGDRIVLAAFGGGTTWGATTLTWPERPPTTPSPDEG